MTRFHFVTEWTFEVPVEQVWALLNEPERFPEWWPGFEQVAKVSGDGEIGSITRYRVRGDFGLAFDFTMQVKEKREPEHLRLTAISLDSASGVCNQKTVKQRSAIHGRSR